MAGGGGGARGGRQLHPDPALLPVLADCYRGMKRWTAVETVWREIRESPSHEVMAEGRIVVAGAYADRGELKGGDRPEASPTPKAPKKVRDFHLRQWYVFADLLDRAGDTMGATRWFRDVLAHDARVSPTPRTAAGVGR